MSSIEERMGGTEVPPATTIAPGTLDQGGFNQKGESVTATQAEAELLEAPAPRRIQPRMAPASPGRFNTPRVVLVTLEHEVGREIDGRGVAQPDGQGPAAGLGGDHAA